MGNDFGENLSALPKVQEFPKVFMKLLQTVWTLWHNLQMFFYLHENVFSLHTHFYSAILDSFISWLYSSVLFRKYLLTVANKTIAHCSQWEGVGIQKLLDTKQMYKTTATKPDVKSTVHTHPIQTDHAWHIVNNYLIARGTSEIARGTSSEIARGTSGDSKRLLKGTTRGDMIMMRQTTHPQTVTESYDMMMIMVKMGETMHSPRRPEPAAGHRSAQTCPHSQRQRGFLGVLPASESSPWLDDTPPLPLQTESPANHQHQTLVWMYNVYF